MSFWIVIYPLVLCLGSFKLSPIVKDLIVKEDHWIIKLPEYQVCKIFRSYPSLGFTNIIMTLSTEI